MRSRRPPTVSRHLRIASLLILAMFLVTGAIGGIGIHASNQVLDETIEGQGLLWSLNQELRVTLGEAELALHRFATAGEEDQLNSYEAARDSFPGLLGLVRELTDRLSGSDREEVRRLLDRQEALFEEWVETYGDPSVEARLEGSPEAEELSDAAESKILTNEIRDASGQISAILIPGFDAATRNLNTLLQRITYALIAALAVGLVVSLRTYWGFRRDLISPMDELQDTLRSTEAGDLGARVEPRGMIEVQGVARALNAMTTENHRLLAAQSKQLERHKQLAGASQKIRSTLDRATIMSAATEAIGLALDSDQVTVRGIGDDGSDLGVATWSAPGLPEMDAPPYDGVTDPVIEELFAGRLVTVEVDNPNHMTPTGQAWMRRNHHRRSVLAPVIAGGHLLAVVGVNWADQNRPVTEEDEVTITAVCRELGTALGHARLYESERKLVAKLQDLDQAKSDFVSMVSHELRSPLTSIMGYLELFQDGDFGATSEEQDEALTVVERNTERLQGLIEDLLTLSRIDAGTFEPKEVPVDMAEVVRSTLDNFAPKVEARHQNLVTEVDDRLPTTIGDPDQMERMVAHLVSNAIKFTPEGGQITVALCETDDRQIELKVSDTGIGISDDEQEQIFTRFFRTAVAQTENIPGTGLGLMIAKEIVTQHGGTISFTSQWEAGTTFTVRLPVTTRIPPGIPHSSTE